MKAVIYEGPGKKSLTEIPDPKLLKPTDAIVEIIGTTICGSDLHKLKGDVSYARPGIALGHEGVARILEVGASVTNFKPGDRVIISCMSICGHCHYCKMGLYSHCEDDSEGFPYGILLGNTTHGTQAEYVRIPFADNSLYLVPEEISDTEAILLSDALPTGYEIGVQYGNVQPGDVIAIIGAGAVGLSAAATSQLHGPSKVIVIDLDDNRLSLAKNFGATNVINSSSPKWEEQILNLTEGRGVDVAIEAVGIPSTFAMAYQIVRPGGRVANIGVHGKPVDFPLNELWIKNITITTGMVTAFTIPLLTKLVAQKRLPVDKFFTHEFKFDQFLEAYDIFSNAAKEKALKVLISA